ncbi:hypothetical protein [Nocardiopsis alborubida]|uniref:Lipoprotein n=1 Tax=Nocardiopsis alborubida TaxID=146802 RepID=A0A7X6MHG8_9ACTN|nr:hypothetical protein [Nocardiopsis alborubida]NKZ00803.1 hypothetical protein [Nocardiopsis alborubida]
MTPTRLAAAAALALLVTSGCGAPRDAAPAGEGAGEGWTAQPTDLPGPRPGRPEADGATRGPERSAAPSAEPRSRPSPHVPLAGTGGEEARAVAASGRAVTGYVDALARAGDPGRMRGGLPRTAEGSAARAYLLHQAAVAQARADGGRPARNAEVGHTPDGYELCPGGDPAAEPDTGPACVAYGGFTAEDGLLTELRVDGRDPGPDLLAAEDVTDESEGVRARLLTAYRAAPDEPLAVTVEFTTEDGVSLDLLQASYTGGGSGGGDGRGRDGQGHGGRGGDERRASEAAGRYALDAGEGTHAAFLFPEAEPGGTLTVGGCLEECSAMVDIELPVG